MWGYANEKEVCRRKELLRFEPRTLHEGSRGESAALLSEGEECRSVSAEWRSWRSERVSLSSSHSARLAAWRSRYALLHASCRVPQNVVSLLNGYCCLLTETELAFR
jgi:hypothetical protein